jgi:hypothetical protein
VTRDLKAYVAKNAPRDIPVGYSATDDPQTRYATWAYLSCAISSNDTSRIDFFGLNNYEWCGAATFETSGYNKMVKTFENTSVPLFFSEYGCNNVYPRVFDEVLSIYSENMTTWSGGLVYEYSNEVSNYGLVNLTANGSVLLLEDFDTLQAQFNKVNLSIVTTASTVNESITPPKCTGELVTSYYSGYYSNFSLPALPDGAQALIDSGIKNITMGKFITVTDTEVTQEVYGPNGALITGLKITPITGDEGNLPSGAVTGTEATNSSSGNSSGGSGGGSSGSGNSTSPKKNGAIASELDGSSVRWMFWIGMAGVAWSMLA